MLSHRFFALLSTPDAFTSALLRRFTRLPYIRTQARWPAEYAARVSLENSWSAAPRATTISIDAPFLFLDSESDRAVAYSKERSVTFDTTTGRISRDGVKTELPVSVSKCDTNRSAFGLSTGSLLISQNNGGLLSLWIPVTLSESNGAAVNAWRDPHEGKVTALAWDRGLNNLLASGSDEILLWDLSGFPSKDEKNRVVGRLVFPDVATEDATPKPVPTVVKLIVSQRGHIFALLSNGLLASWTLELLQLLQKPNADPVLPNYTTQLDPTAAILGFENDAASGRLLACSESECTVFSNSLSEHARLFVPIGEKLSVATWDRIYAPLEPTLIQPNPKPLSAIALGTESGSILLYDLPGHAVNEPIAPRLSLPYPSRSDGSGRVTHLLVGAVVVVSGHRDGSLLIRSVLSGALLRRLELNLPRVQRTIESDGDGVMSLAISEARGKIVAGIGGGGIRIWSFGGVHEGPWKQQGEPRRSFWSYFGLTFIVCFQHERLLGNANRGIGEGRSRVRRGSKVSLLYFFPVSN